jgi:hypothetical protein
VGGETDLREQRVTLFEVMLVSVGDPRRERDDVGLVLGFAFTLEFAVALVFAIVGVLSKNLSIEACFNGKGKARLALFDIWAGTVA